MSPVEHVDSEHGRLTSVAVVSPVHFHETDAINSRQMFEYNRSPIDRDALTSEHNSMVAALLEFGTNVVEVDPHPLLPYALNVRDTIVVVGNVAVAGAMGRAIRESEPFWNAPQLGLGAKAKFLSSGRLEGGDVLVFQSQCIVGISERTDATGAGAIANLTGRPVTPILLAPGVLHLDTALNVIGDVAIVARDLIEDPDSAIERLERLGITTFVALTAEQAWNLESNFLALDPHTVLISESSRVVIGELERHGIRSLTVPMAEHHRIGGSVRCATLPLAREVVP